MSHSKMISGASVSDIHFNHARNSTKAIVNNLRLAFPDDERTGELDIIFIAGDVFDSLVNLASEDCIEADFWIADFLFMCKKRNIILRVLEGTPSHEWKQSKRFEAINKYSKIDANVRHVTDVSIEYIQELDINVLYIPDEAPGGPEATLAQVHELMFSKGLKQVDYAVMHGQFDFQIPAISKAPFHDSDQYLKIVSDYIFIGHDHTYSSKDRIFAQGSFDRLGHGYEDPKGHIRFKVQKGVSRKAIFVENKTARVFKTISCIGLPIEDSLERIDYVMREIPEESSVRIEAETGNPILSSMEQVLIKYPFTEWSKVVRPVHSDSEEKDEQTDDEIYIPITITRDNVVRLTMDKFASLNGSSAYLERAEQILSELI